MDLGSGSSGLLSPNAVSDTYALRSTKYTPAVRNGLLREIRSPKHQISDSQLVSLARDSLRIGSEDSQISIVQSGQASSRNAPSLMVDWSSMNIGKIPVEVIGIIKDEIER